MSPRDNSDADVARLTIQVAHLEGGQEKMVKELDDQCNRITSLEHTKVWVAGGVAALTALWIVVGGLVASTISSSIEHAKQDVIREVRQGK